MTDTQFLALCGRSVGSSQSRATARGPASMRAGGARTLNDVGVLLNHHDCCWPQSVCALRGTLRRGAGRRRTPRPGGARVRAPSPLRSACSRRRQ
eukprot:12710638-Alexandrium_andersonii.AAC.1